MKIFHNLDTGMLDHYDEEGELLYSNPFFKTPYNHDRDQESDRTGTKTEGTSLTDQSFKDDADINVIMERVLKSRELPLALPEHFGDGTNIPDLFTARLRIAESNAAFYRLPAKIREEFLNDPGRWEQQVVKDLQAATTASLANLKRMGIDADDIHVIQPKAPEKAPGDTPAPEAKN